MTETVVFAVAAARDVCPTDLETPLHSAVDADALDRLHESVDRGPSPDSLRVEFTWAGCDVVVHGTGRVVATRSTAAADEPHPLAT